MLRKIRKMLKQQEGFTLVELMIVVVILGILAGVGIQQYGKIQDNARTAAHNANVKVITSAANMYLMVHNDAPDSIDALVTAGYLDSVPVNPLTRDGMTSPYTLTVVRAGAGPDFWTITVNPSAITE